MQQNIPHRRARRNAPHNTVYTVNWGMFHLPPSKSHENSHRLSSFLQKKSRVCQFFCSCVSIFLLVCVNFFARVCQFFCSCAAFFLQEAHAYFLCASKFDVIPILVERVRKDVMSDTNKPLTPDYRYGQGVVPAANPTKDIAHIIIGGNCHSSQHLPVRHTKCKAQPPHMELLLNHLKINHFQEE
jgi:hypothetical protein